MERKSKQTGLPMKCYVCIRRLRTIKKGGYWISYISLVPTCQESRVAPFSYWRLQVGKEELLPYG